MLAMPFLFVSDNRHSLLLLHNDGEGGTKLSRLMGAGDAIRWTAEKIRVNGLAGRPRSLSYSCYADRNPKRKRGNTLENTTNSSLTLRVTMECILPSMNN